MGIRSLLVTPEILLNFCKEHNGNERTYTVTNPVPDDAELLRFAQDTRPGVLKFILSSETWEGDLPEETITPTVTVHYHDG